MPNSALFKRPAVLIALAIFAFSLLVRLVGIGWGLANDIHNQSYHPDEIVNLGVANRVNLGAGQVTPGMYNYGTAYFYAYSIACKMVSAYGGEPAENASDREVWAFQRRCELAGRVISALAGAGIVVIVWLICRRITSNIGALFGAGLACFAPGPLVHSRFATVDIFGVFFLALSALFALRILGSQPGSRAEIEGEAEKGSVMRNSLLAGLFAGISAGTKYTGILILLVLFIVLAMKKPAGWWKAALAGFGACVAALLITTPGMLLDSAKFWTDFQYEMNHSASGHGLIFIGTSSGFLYHLGNLMVGVGVLALLASLFSLIYGSVKRHTWAIALLAFFVVYYIAIGRAEVKFLRYIFPLLVPMSVALGYGVGAAFREGTSRAKLCIVAGVFAVTGNPFFDFGGLIGAARYTQFMAGNDPRDEALMWLRDVAANKTLGIVKDPWFWSVPVVQDAGLTRDKIGIIYQEVATTQNPKVLRYIPQEGFAQREDWDARLLTELKPDYIVYTDFEFLDEERLSKTLNLDPGTAAAVDRFNLFKEELSKFYAPVTGFGGLVPEIHDLMYIHPSVYVWKRK